MEAPKCGQCGHAHWSHQAHVWTDQVANKPSPLVANVLKVANIQLEKVANRSRHGQYADKDKRRSYMREYMRTYRA